MAVAKQNGDVIPFVKQKDYIMVNNDLGGGSFGKTVLLQDPFIDELFVAKKYEPEYDGIKEQFYKNFLDEIKILYKLNHRNESHSIKFFASLISNPSKVQSILNSVAISPVALI